MILLPKFPVKISSIITNLGPVGVLLTFGRSKFSEVGDEEDDGEFS
jgi:hypothetical protein